MSDEPRERDSDALRLEPAPRDENTADMFGPAPSATEAASPATKPYVVLARKYRPATFDDLIGQDAMVQTLRNAFAAERIAQAYMLTGVRGVGKTTTARILARALNYETDTIDRPTIDMPGLGRHCQEIIESRHPDVIEMDAASNTGVDNIRELIEGARYKPISARIKVYIIDEVHMLSRGAFNALLKTLEEPPPHVKFIFATTEIRKVPVTVLSRCQRFDLRRVDVPMLTDHLARIADAEQTKADRQALMLVARAAEGSVRDSLSILDQAIAMGSGQVTVEGVRAMLGLADRGRIFDLLELVLKGDAGAAVLALEALHRDGADSAEVISDLAEVVHAAARTAVVADAGGTEHLSAEEQRRASTLATRVSIPLLSRVWQMLLKGLEDVSRAPAPLAAAEMVLIRIAYAADLPSPDDIIKAIGGEAIRRPAQARSASPEQRTPTRPMAELASAAPTSRAAPPPAPAVVQALADDPSTDEPPAYLDDPDDPGAGFEADDTPPPRPVLPALRPLKSFADVVALAGERRDIKLKVHLEEHVSLVSFDTSAEGTGQIEIFLLANAPVELPNELREKLNLWTSRRWVIAVAKRPGERPIGEVRREQQQRELEVMARHPAVAAVLTAFPGAVIDDVRTVQESTDEPTARGTETSATG